MIFVRECLNYSFLKIRLGIVGRLYVSLYCLIQVDIKIIVAYSSVIHINFIICSLFSLLNVGALRRVIVMGFSWALFIRFILYSVNIYHLRSYRRLIIMNKGHVNYIPTVTVWWFLFLFI